MTSVSRKISTQFSRHKTKSTVHRSFKKKNNKTTGCRKDFSFYSILSCTNFENSIYLLKFRRKILRLWAVGSVYNFDLWLSALLSFAIKLNFELLKVKHNFYESKVSIQKLNCYNSRVILFSSHFVIILLFSELD